VNDENSLFAELDDFGPTCTQDELEDYLASPTIVVQDPLMWWHTLGDSPLARMGRDFMSAPGM
jgi:hypothetical protein